VIFAMGLAGGLLNLAAPIATGVLFDSAIPGARREEVAALSTFLVMAAISSMLFTLTRNFATLRLQGRLDASLQAAAWDRLLRLPVPFFRSYSSGDLAVRSMAFNDIRQVLAGPVLSLIVSQTFSILSVGLLFVYSPRLAFIACGLIVAALAVSGFLLYLNLRYSRDVVALRGRIAGMTAEFVQGVAKFRMSGAEGRALAVWARATGDRKLATMRACQTETWLLVFNAAWPLICAAVIFHAALTLTGPGPDALALTTGQFLAFLAVFTQVVASALQFAYMLCPVLAIVPVYERVRPLLEAVPEVNTAKAPPGELTGAIEISHLAFRYGPDLPPVLRGVSARILPGEMIAIVGGSGCGKSTLFRLLLGFEAPESGSVYYDGQDLSGLDVQAVRRQVGVVLQSPKFGSGTLLNLILGSTGLSPDDAWEGARMSGLDRDIKAMPMGMHTVVSDSGGTLSGGQRQRLMIARAIVSKPRILLFDEATSALDNETQAIVTRSLESLRATRIVIAHRLSTILNADRILVLDHGVVAQAGTYDELMVQEGPFRELANRQLA
jgi:NHLM bacteriocin system ABC transporter ATP-binding protein